MELNIIKIGNSKGLRLPQSILKEYNIGESVDLVLKEGYIEIRPKSKARENWRTELNKMAADPNEETRIEDFFEDEEL